MKIVTLKNKFYTDEEVYSFKFIDGKPKIEKFKICYVRATIKNKVFVSYLDSYWREFSEETCFKTLKGVKNYLNKIKEQNNGKNNRNDSAYIDYFSWNCNR